MEAVYQDSRQIELSIERICASSGFRRSARLQRFLRFLASAQSASGHGPKEYEVARAVYDKPQNFDPQTDPIVRVEASRLRLRMIEYYQGPGREDDTILELPKGSYALRCIQRGRTAAGPPPQLNGARQYYLRGRYLWARRTTESLDEAIVCFRKAIDADCLDSAAWSGLADCYSVMGCFELMPPHVVFPRAIAAARKALELDPSSAEAHCSLAMAAGIYEWNAEEAFAGFGRAIALNPEYASAWQFYGVVLFGRGLFARSLNALERACSIDPLSPIMRVQVASLHFLMRDYGQACRICDEVIRLDPDFWPARWFAGMALQQQGRLREANRHLDAAVHMSNRSGIPLGALGHLAGCEGRREFAVAIADELEQRRLEQHCSALSIGLVYLGCGDRQTALRWITKASEERSPLLPMFLMGDPRLDPIRAEPEIVRITAELEAGSGR